jgi:hypothetical protein
MHGIARGFRLASVATLVGPCESAWPDIAVLQKRSPANRNGEARRRRGQARSTQRRRLAEADSVRTLPVTRGAKRVSHSRSRGGTVRTIVRSAYRSSILPLFKNQHARDSACDFDCSHPSCQVAPPRIAQPVPSPGRRLEPTANRRPGLRSAPSLLWAYPPKISFRSATQSAANGIAMSATTNNLRRMDRAVLGTLCEVVLGSARTERVTSSVLTRRVQRTLPLGVCSRHSSSS